MINQKYLQDIQKFPEQFDLGLEITDKVDLKSYPEGQFKRIILCGMGGSSLYGDLLNQIFAKPLVYTHAGYGLPEFAEADDLVICASYSGNTEEVLDSFAESMQAHENGMLSHPPIVFSAGGKLAELAETNGLPLFSPPTGIQPRLTTGYFIAFMYKLISNCLGITAGNVKRDLSKGFSELNKDFTENEKAEMRLLAKKLIDKTAIIYGDDANWAIAKICKIKFNENAKVQAFWNYFPELNHNEMVGFTRITSNPHFLILKSKFSHSRISDRIRVFSKLMRDKGQPVDLIELKGDSVIAEMLYAYYACDHITYYLAEEYGIDPEPVKLVEEFKDML